MEDVSWGTAAGSSVGSADEACVFLQVNLISAHVFRIIVPISPNSRVAAVTYAPPVSCGDDAWFEVVCSTDPEVTVTGGSPLSSLPGFGIA